MSEVMCLSLSALGALLRNGELSAGELLVEASMRHQTLGGHLNAYSEWNQALAAEAARFADRAFRAGEDHGPLQGIPISIKDLFGVDGFQTHAGSPNPLPLEWRREGAVIQTLRQQLAVPVGKTQMVEFAFGGLGTNPHWGTPRNPWDAVEHRVPGGSSAGAGVSLHEGSAKVALGSDTAGSVRIPASFTGTVGMKTTKGRWSTDGIVPLSPALDTAGLLAMTVADAAIAFSALDPETRGTAWIDDVTSCRDLTFGITDDFFWDGPKGVNDAVRTALGELEAAGARVDRTTVDQIRPAFDLFLSGGPVSIEFNRFLTEELPDWLATLEPNVRRRLEGAASIPATEYAARLEQMQQLAGAVATVFERVDVLVSPTVPLTPPTVDEVAADYRRLNVLALHNTSVVNYLGLAALTLPVGLDDNRMPVGMQLIAPAGGDRRLLAIGLACEQVLGDGPTRLGRPPLTTFNAA